MKVVKMHAPFHVQLNKCNIIQNNYIDLTYSFDISEIYWALNNILNTVILYYTYIIVRSIYIILSSDRKFGYKQMISNKGWKMSLSKK